METIVDRNQLEGLTRQPSEELIQTAKKLLTTKNKLITVIEDANNQLLTVAGTIEEPDKILVVSKYLCEALADTARL